MKDQLISSIMPIILDKNFSRQEKYEHISNIMDKYWNLAIQDAADNADADFTEVDRGEDSLPLIEVYVIKGSILKLLKK